MEIALHIGLISGALFFSFDNSQKQGRGFFAFYVFAVIASSLIVRQNFSNDIEAYSYWLETSFWQTYLNTEPVAWFGLRVIFEISQDLYATWIVADLLIGLLLYRVLTKLKCPKYVFFLIIASFPFVLGSQNVFRQHLASVFFLYALTFDTRINALLVTAISLLSHNMAALFAPIIFIAHTRLNVLTSSLGFPFWLFIVPIPLYILQDYKSHADTGGRSEMLYISFLIALLLLFALPRQLRINIKSKYISLVLFGLINGLVAMPFLGSAQVERIFLFSLFVLLPFVAVEFEKHMEPKLMGRTFVIFLFGAPTFMGGSYAALTNIS